VAENLQLHGCQTKQLQVLAGGPVTADSQRARHVECFERCGLLQLHFRHVHDAHGRPRCGEPRRRSGAPVREKGRRFSSSRCREKVVEESHIVYADARKICCWLWNHRDNRECAVTSSTRRSLFIIDAAEERDGPAVRNALDMLAENFEHIGCTVRSLGIIDRKSPEAQAGG